MANDGPIAAALSAFTGKNIISYDEYLRRRDEGGIQWVAIDNDNLANMCYDVEDPPMTQEPAIDEVVTPVTMEQSVKVAIPNTTDEVVNVTVTGDSRLRRR
ncbi:hypothetical protein BC938DRAFT_473942 [Jimgerdemannia flammicorona]|uniref:Uncharacterized protein n=1 Tax=Jimgerdemannia flammicorona TaxID=994334 RepID=A0A433QSY8_9FUNG|nr:hypothetical protein BC938DRAFT_473942 [Jimgerdemannia flammicorona]